MKRNIANGKDDSGSPSGKKKLKTEKNINNTNSTDLQKSSNGNKTHKKKKYGVTITLQKDISYKCDQDLFKKFEDADDIIVGRDIFIQYSSYNEALKKVTELSGTSYAGQNIKARPGFFPKVVKHVVPESKKSQAVRCQTFPSLQLEDIPVNVNISKIKANFPSATFVSKRKKRVEGKFKKFYILRYSNQAEAEKDLKRSETMEIEGQNVIAKLNSSQNGQGKVNSTENNGENSPKIANDSKISAVKEGGTKRKKRKPKKMLNKS